MRGRGYVFGSVVALLVGVVPTTHAAQSVKTFDRTLVCTTGDGGPKIAAVTATRTFPPGINVERTFTGGHSTLVVVTAGPRSVLAIDEQFCKRSTNRVPLTPEGLPKPPRAFGFVKCPVGRILIRVRYTYVPGLRQRGADLGGRLVSAAVAVRSYRALKPLALATLSAKKPLVRLYNANVCTPA